MLEATSGERTWQAVVADPDAAWASEFAEVDRAAARDRLGTMIEAHGKAQQAVEAEAVTYDRKIVGQVSARRIAKGKPGLTPEQEADMLKERATRRAAGN